jgi:hypothetical protein
MQNYVVLYKNAVSESGNGGMNASWHPYIVPDKCDEQIHPMFKKQYYRAPVKYYVYY